MVERGPVVTSVVVASMAVIIWTVAAFTLGPVVFKVVSGLTAALILVLASEFFLAALVIRRGMGRESARFLAAELVLHPVALIPPLLLAMLWLWGVPVHEWVLYTGRVVPNMTGFESVTWSEFFALVWLPVLLTFVAASSVSFALTYPSRLVRLQGRSWPFVLMFTLPTILAAYAAVELVRNWGTRYPATLDNPPVILGVPGAFVVSGTGGLALLAATVTAASIFRRRSRTGATQLERARAGFMLKAIMLPILVAFALLLLGPLIEWASFDTALREEAEIIGIGVGGLAVITYALVRPFAMSYGLLRFGLLDLDQRVRRGARVTVSYGLLATLFAVTFFIVSEGTEAIFRQATNSNLIGLTAAGVVAIGLVPLHRRADRFARRLLPPDDESKQFIKSRRLEAYQGAFEDLSAMGPLKPEHRAALRVLARRLGLTPAELAALESGTADDPAESSTATSESGGGHETAPESV